MLFLPDGKRALSSAQDGLRLWDLDKGEKDGLIRAFAAGRASFGLGLASDGKRCVSAEPGGRVWTFDLETGKELAEFRGHTKYVWVTLFLPGDGEVLTSGYDGQVLTWDPATGEKKRQFEGAAGHSPRCGAVSHDGKRLATGDTLNNPTRGRVQVWDLETGKAVRDFAEHGGEISSVSWSPDDRRLLTSCFDGTVRVWDAETGKELKVLKQAGGSDCAAWLPDGKRVLTTPWSGENVIRLWDVESGQVLRTFTGHKEAAITVVVAADGQTALTTGKDGTVRLWNLRPIEPAVLDAHEGEAWAVAFSPDGKLLATAGADRTVRLWDVSGDRERPGYGRPVRRLEGLSGNVFCVAFSPDGKRLAAGDGDLFGGPRGEVRVWDVERGTVLATLRGHTGTVRAVAFSPDGKLLASAGYDRTVRLWDAETGAAKATLTGHAKSVLGLAWGPDNLLASAGGDPMNPGDAGEVLLWDAASGKRRGPLVGHRAGITGVAISPDGASLFGPGYDETVRIWSLPSRAP